MNVQFLLVTYMALGSQYNKESIVSVQNPTGEDRFQYVQGMQGFTADGNCGSTSAV